MVNFTHYLLSAATVAALSGLDANAVNPSELVSATPKVISVAKADLLGAKSAKKSVSHRAPVKKVKTKSPHKVTHFPLTEDELEVLYTCSCSFLTEGSETEPAELELDDWDNIPEELIGEENYGFGGQGLMQAGGAMYVPFQYTDPDDDSWEMEGMFWTPDLYEAMTVTIELDAKIVEGSDVESDELWAYASDYSNLLDSDYDEIDTEWKRVSITLDISSFVQESEDDSYYFTLFADNGADIVVKDIVIKGEKPELQVPVAENYTDYTGTSFTAHWAEVENATGYYLTVYNYDVAEGEATSTFLDAEYTEETSYTVEGLTVGNFYSYEVTATNGSFTTAPSNTIFVCELVSPTGLEITPSSDHKSLNFTWEASQSANYYVLNVSAVHDVTANEEVTLADADFSAIESTGTVAAPVESEYWHDSLSELPGWQFSLGCSAEGAYGFMDNSLYTYYTGLYASLESMDYDLSNIKDGKVSVSVEAASPGNGMLVGLLSFNKDEDKYEVGSAYATPDDVPEDFETYNFTLTGASAQSRFIFMTRTADNADGSILIRTLKLTGVAAENGTVKLPLGEIETEETQESVECEIEEGVTYCAYVVPYLVDDDGYILAIGAPSDTATYKAESSGVDSVIASDNDSVTSYYNLQGQKIDRPVKGSVVIKVNNSEATKIVL